MTKKLEEMNYCLASIYFIIHNDTLEAHNKFKKIEEKGLNDKETIELLYEIRNKLEFGETMNMERNHAINMYYKIKRENRELKEKLEKMADVESAAYKALEILKQFGEKDKEK